MGVGGAKLNRSGGSPASGNPGAGGRNKKKNGGGGKGGKNAGGNGNGGGAKQGRNEFDYLQLPGNKQLHEETTDATNLAYRPTERSIAAEKRASQQRTKNEGTWWNEYLSQVGAGQAATQGAYQAAANQTQGIIGTASAVDSANTAGQNASAAQAAAARGQDATAANAATSSTANAAQATRNAAIGALGAKTAGQGANQFAYLGEQKRVGAGQRVAAMTNQAKKTASIEQDRTALRKERGEYAAKTLGQKEAEGREILLKKQAFNYEKEAGAASAEAEAKKLHMENLEFLAEQGNKQAELELKGLEAEISKQNANTSQYSAHHPNAGEETPGEEASKAAHNAYSTARTLYERGPKKGKEWPSWAALIVAVQKEGEVNGAEARAAVAKIKKQLAAEERKQREAEGRTGQNTGGGQGGIHR